MKLTPSISAATKQKSEQEWTLIDLNQLTDEVLESSWQSEESTKAFDLRRPDDILDGILGKSWRASSGRVQNSSNAIAQIA